MAISCTVTSTKIDITSTGGVQETFGSVVTAVNAVTAGTITGSGTSGDPYVITSTTYGRELEISSGCKVKWEANTFTSWQWNNASNTVYVLDLAAGSEIEIEEGCEFDLGIAGTYRRGYSNFQGKITIAGVSGNEVIFKNMRSNYLYPRYQDWDIDYVKFQDTTYVSGYMIYFTYDQYYSTHIPQVSMTHITVENTNSNYYGRLYFNYMTSPLDNYTFEDWDIKHLEYPFYATSSNFHIKRFKFSDSKNQVIVYGSGNGVGIPYTTSKTKLYNDKEFQPKNIFEECEWSDTDNAGTAGNGVYCANVYYAGRTVFKNCKFSNQSHGVYANYGALVLWQGTQTWTSVTTHRIWANQGTHLHVYALDHTVNDDTGSPIENAAVSFVESSNPSKHWEAGLTNSDGKLVDVWGEKPVFVNKEEYSTGNYYTWGSYKVLSSYSGYKNDDQDITFDSDKTIVAGLSLEDDEKIVFIDSTLNALTID